MRYFFKQSVSQLQNKDGMKKSSFEIIKGQNGEIHKLKGTTNNQNSGVYKITQDNMLQNKTTGIIHTKHRIFKIKSSDILSILKESKESNKLIKNKKPVKSSDTKKSVKKPTKSTDAKKSVKKPTNAKKSVKKVTKPTDSKKSVKKATKPTDAKKSVKKTTKPTDTKKVKLSKNVENK